jgi:hypothetical protein
MSIIGGGVGASATCSVETSLYGVSRININNNGNGYITPPIVTINGPVGSGQTATAISIVGTDQSVSSFGITNPGSGYTISPIVNIANPPVIFGFGTYQFNEIIFGSISGTTARVKSWDFDTKVLKVSFVDNAATSGFYPGEVIIGSSSNAYYAVQSYDTWDQYDKYSENIEIENAADGIIDFSESNPFGTF